MIKRISLLAVLICSSYAFVYSQCDNSFFDSDKYEHAIDSGHWQFHFDKLSYFRNTEQTSFVDKGVTYIGFHLQPYVQYSFNQNAEIFTGMFLRYDFGNTNIHTIEPYFKFKYKLWDHDIIFGSLEGAQQHRLIEPLYDYENAITDRYENGVQIRRSNKRLEYDVWLDWQTMIYENDPFNEVFFAGINVSLDVIDKEKTQFTLTGQGTTVHAAGEIDKSPDPNTMEYNYAFGAELKQEVGSETSIIASIYGAAYEDYSSQLATGFIDGTGTLANLRLLHKEYEISLHYWDSYQFQSPSGEQLYHSLGNKNRTRPIDSRQIAGLRISFEKEIGKNLVFLSRNGLIYNIDHNKADVIMESYLRWHFTNKQPKLLNIN